ALLLADLVAQLDRHLLPLLARVLVLADRASDAAVLMRALVGQAELGGLVGPAGAGEEGEGEREGDRDGAGGWHPPMLTDRHRRRGLIALTTPLEVVDEGVAVEDRVAHVEDRQDDVDGLARLDAGG